MKALLTSCLLFVFATASALAADDATTQAVRAADDARVAAMTSADGAKLAEYFSDDLHYAHASGSVDTKKSLSDALTSGRTKYVSIDYEERAFTPAAPNVELMTGRAHLKVTSDHGQLDAVLGFLAVWRNEDGHWRLLAWQSCKLPTPTN